MDKEILKRGYVTYALTNELGEVYGQNITQYINFKNNPVETAHTFYWSEVYCEPNLVIIIRKGILLHDVTPKELFRYFEKSKVNLMY